jgi:hypothetical protein
VVDEAIFKVAIALRFRDCSSVPRLLFDSGIAFLLEKSEQLRHQLAAKASKEAV